LETTFLTIAEQRNCWFGRERIFRRVVQPWLPKVLVHQFLEVAQRPDGAVIVERQHLHHLDGTDGQLSKMAPHRV
jgi:hypothetical protein